MSLQVETLENFVTQKPDGIMLAAVDLNAVARSWSGLAKQVIVVTTFGADAATKARDMFVNRLFCVGAAKTTLRVARCAGRRRDRIHRGVFDLGRLELRPGFTSERTAREARN